MHSEDSGSIIVKLDRKLLNAIDRIREEWGIRSRADIIERAKSYRLPGEMAGAVS